MLQAYGAEMVFSDPGEGSDGAIRLCREIYKADPDRYFYPDQYNNPANWKAHYEGTALEILAQTDGRITHFVACMGTSGTFIGNSRRLRKEIPGIKCISAQPSSGFHGLEGLKHMPTAIVPGIYDPDAGRREHLDRNRRRLRDVPATGSRRSAAGRAFLQARTWWRHARWRGDLAEAGERGVIVTMLCDGAYKYLSEPFWNDSN